MQTLSEYLETQLAQGRANFSKATALEELQLSPQAFKSAITRLTQKGRALGVLRGRGISPVLEAWHTGFRFLERES